MKRGGSTTATSFGVNSVVIHHFRQPCLTGKRTILSKPFADQNLTTFFFLVDEWREDSNTTLSGPSSARQRNAILMAFRWRANDCPILNAGFVAL